MLAFAEFKAKAAEGVGLTCRVVILVPAFGPATMGPCVATIVVPLASPLDGARRARILSGNIIGQPSSRGSATFRSSSSPELRSCLASRACEDEIAIAGRDGLLARTTSSSRERLSGNRASGGGHAIAICRRLRASAQVGGVVPTSEHQRLMPEGSKDQQEQCSNASHCNQDHWCLDFVLG